MSPIGTRRDARPATTPATQPDPAARRRWLALAVLAIAQFMVFLDETVVNVALPSIKTSLGFSQSSLAWVINAYVLVFGGLILLGGRTADLAGRRKMFLAGTAIFGLASLLDGLATSQAMLIGARALQGAGAALATPAALALVTSLFPAGPARTKALTLWGALSGLGFAAGVLLGGVITQAASWRWVFLINVPIALAGLVAVPRLVTESRNPGRPGFDLAGAITITAGMSTLVYTLLDGGRYGWTSATTAGLFAVAAVLLGAFAVIESRATVPLIPRGFLHRRATLAPTTLQWLLTGSAFSSLFMLALYLQQVLRYSPLQAGIGYLPLAAAVVAASATASKLVPRFGPRPLAVSGLALVGAGLVLLGHAPASATYTANILPAWSSSDSAPGSRSSPSPPPRSPRSRRPPRGWPPGCCPAPRSSAAPWDWPSSSRLLPPAPPPCSAPAPPRWPRRPAACGSDSCSPPASPSPRRSSRRSPCRARTPPRHQGPPPVRSRPPKPDSPPPPIAGPPSPQGRELAGAHARRTRRMEDLIPTT